MSKLIYLKPTETCQLNCAHCFTGGNSHERNFIDPEKFSSWYKKLTNHFHDERFTVNLHGGEPFLAPVSLLKTLVSIVKEYTPDAHIGITTNLVFTLDKEKIDFIDESMGSIGTSWDTNIRFSNVRQESLWRKNLQTLISNGRNVTLNISVTKALIEMNQEYLLRFIRGLSVDFVRFERITGHGNALKYPDLFPTNTEINNWYMDLHRATERLNARDWFYNETLESVYSKFERGIMCSGTYCRNCESSLFTYNSDGTIGGCPNSAPYEYFGKWDMDIDSLLTSNNRIDAILDESIRKSECMNCSVHQYCGGDCHRLEWESSICPAPKQLMFELAGLEYKHTKSRKVIPIRSIV